MTSNQIAYQANLERERTNRANELIGNRQADASLRQAAVSERKAKITELEYALKETKNAAEIKKIEAEIERLKHQNVTDTVNAITGGVANIGRGVGSVINPLLK